MYPSFFGEIIENHTSAFLQLICYIIFIADWYVVLMVALECKKKIKNANPILKQQNLIDAGVTNLEDVQNKKGTWVKSYFDKFSS